jgi:hypothetical protein
MVLVARLVVSVPGAANLPAVTVPLQPLAVYPLRVAVVGLVVVTLIPVKMQPPLPSMDVLFDLPVPEVVEYGCGLIVADAGPAKNAADTIAIDATSTPRSRSFMRGLQIVLIMPIRQQLDRTRSNAAFANRRVVMSDPRGRSPNRMFMLA